MYQKGLNFKRKKLRLIFLEYFMKKKLYKLSGVDCANCGLKIEDKLIKLNGVNYSSFTFITSRLIVIYDENIILEEKIENTIKNTIYGVRIISKKDLELTDEDINICKPETNKVKRILFNRKKR